MIGEPDELTVIKPVFSFSHSSHSPVRLLCPSGAIKQQKPVINLTILPEGLTESQKTPWRSSDKNNKKQFNILELAF